MKKMFSILAMVLMISSLSGCMDSPDAGNKKPSNFGSEQQKAG